ncbi:hypothetical protein F4604DRAFT_1684125 [Suillus subluteus]|nr:hypothetical protein F4604DRAFT_1684125 [Suillus subluteus]
MEGEIEPQDGGECYQASRETEEAAKKRTDCLEKIIQPYENDSDEHTYFQADNSKYDQRKSAPEPSPKAEEIETHRISHERTRANHGKVRRCTHSNIRKDNDTVESIFASSTRIKVGTSAKDPRTS